MESALIVVLLVCSVAVSRNLATAAACECGWKAVCSNSSACVCPPGYRLHENKRDCLNYDCSTKDCLECNSDTDQCNRCVHFIDKDSRHCLTVCKGESEFLLDGELQGTVCEDNSDKAHRDLIIGIVAGVFSGLLLCVIMAVLFYCHLKRTRKQVNLQQRKLDSNEIQLGKMKKFPAYYNNAFEEDLEVNQIRNCIVDKEVYIGELERLRPHAQILLTLLSQVRRKVRAMSENDTRVPTYKGVIHQLCRVLVLLHKKDPTTSIPSDALGLLEWAQQMLEDARESQLMEQNNSGGSQDPNLWKISTIDRPVGSHVYASPNLTSQEPNNINLNPTYYSSAPVPYVENKVPTYDQPMSVSQINNSSVSGVKDKSLSKKDKNFHNNVSYDQGGVGYFSNGRYYDPSPRNGVYAPPSSSYSESHQPLSTFFERPASQSYSSSDAATDGNDEEPSLNEDNDVFPFDPKEATSPVDV